MKFKIVISVLFLVLIAIQGNAQKVVIDASLKNILGPSQETEITTENVPDSLKEWIFDKCSTKIINGSNYLSISGNGSVATAPFSDDIGNIIISAFIYSSVANQKINFTIVGDDELESSLATIGKANSWFTISSKVLRNAAKNTRLKISSDNDFIIVNLKVKDVRDGIYYESFNRYDYGGGNDGDFATDGISNFNPVDFDNPTTIDKIPAVKWASKCIFCMSNGKYTTNNVPQSDAKDFILTFRTAAKNSNSKLEVTYNISNSQTKTIDLTQSLRAEEWCKVTIVMPKDICGRSITFSGDYVYLDEILVSEVKEICLNEKANSAELLNRMVNHKVNASLTRTFKANIWNTCCLPFEITDEQLREAADDSDITVQLRRLTSIADGVFMFTPANSIPAGRPFILQVSKDIVNPVFRQVDIACSKPYTSISKDGLYKFQGIFSPTALNTDGTHVFIGTDGNLHIPTDNNVMNGMRAYIVVPQNSDARLFFMDEEVTELRKQNIEETTESSATYNMMGQRVLGLKKGLNIKNGKVIFVR